MADLNPFDAAEKMFLASVGAMVTVGDKSSEAFDNLVKRGQTAVQQGQNLNEELKHTTSNAAHNFSESALKTWMQTMKDDELKDFVKKVETMASEIEANRVTVDVEDVEDASDKDQDKAE